MLPKIFTYFSTTSTLTRRLYCTFSPLALLGLILVLHPVISGAERDFNFNDSQVPLIEPKDEPILIDHPSGGSTHQDPYAVELSHCRYGENETVLSLVLKNYNWHDLNESRQAKVLEKLSKFFAIPKEFITMESVTKHELFEMQKESLKRGNNKCHNNRKLGRVNFIIGCGSKYFKMSEPISKQIGQQVKDGALDNIIGEKFGWWVIWRKQFKPQSKRNRRQIEGSGEDDDDDDFDTYDYGEDEDTAEQDPVNDISTTTTHAHRHHHGDTTSEITSNMLEVANTKNDNDIQNVNDVHKNDDITALKQTDNNVNEEHPQTESNLLLLNKKGSIDEEIVESVSQLESVITKTIENTKNLEDLPEIVVDQPDDELLTAVLQPLMPVEDIDSTKKSENINLNSIYDNTNEEDTLINLNNNDNDFQVAEVVDSLTPSTSTVTNRKSATSTGVNLPDNIENISASTTPLSFSLNNNSNNNQKDKQLSASLNNEHLSPSHVSMHPHQHSPSQTSDSSSNLLTDSTTITTITTTSHLSPTAILIDSTTSTTNTPIDYSSVTSSATMSSSSSSASTSSTISSNILNKYEMTTYTPNEMIHTHNNDDDEDDNDDDVKAEAEEQELPDMNVRHGGLLNTFTTVITPASTMMLTTEQQQEHQQHYYENDANIELTKTKSTTLLTTSSSASASASNNNMLATPTTTTIKTPHFNLLTITTPSSSSSTSTPASSAAATIVHELLEVPIEIVIDINGKKDMTTLVPEDNGDSTSKSPSSTSQSTDDVSTISSSTSQAITTPATIPDIIVSSTSVVPDYIEPKIENSPPMIKSRLQKLAVTSGKSFKLPVPDDTFYDNEDLSNLRLELTDKDGRELKTNSWLQFNAETKEIYGLPLDDAVSKWLYRLTATDSGNESVTETLEISVQQHRGVRTVNHEINIAVKINEKNMHYIDWQMSLLNAIATTLGDDNANSIVVREIRANPQDPSTATLVYFNETLPTTECPEIELNALVQRLDANRLSDLVQPTLGIKSITGQLIGSCQKTMVAKPKTPTLNVKNYPPIPRNQVDRVVATVGHLLVYKVPSDTFFDPNDNELTLSLKTKEHKELSPRHWLQFDSKNDEFYGIPKSGDTGSEEYMLVAEDADGLSATDALVVQVNHAPKKEFSVYFKAYLAIRHEQFNADFQRKFVERIAALFGDASTQNIQIRSITTHHDSDGTIVNFYNTTLFKSHNRCPEEEMEALRSVYLQDYTLRERIKKELGPELNITNVQVVPLGSCNVQTDVTHREFVPNKTEEPLLKSTFSDDYMLTIILPAIVIVSMILIAALIACCLHRRRRKSGKMELGDEEERKSFRTKGIPVIFQDELDEKPEIGNKSPIILKDEKPPLLPPSYNTSNMNGDNDVDEYVPPPAVVVGGREARGKSPATPSYRKPPPYVSP